MPQQVAQTSAKREGFVCKDDQFDRIVAFAEKRGMQDAPLHLVISEWKRCTFH